MGFKPFGSIFKAEQKKAEAQREAYIKARLEEIGVSLVDIFGPEPTTKGIAVLEGLTYPHRPGRKPDPNGYLPRLVHLAQRQGLAQDYDRGFLYRQGERIRRRLLEEGEFGPEPGFWTYGWMKSVKEYREAAAPERDKLGREALRECMGAA